MDERKELLVVKEGSRNGLDFKPSGIQTIFNGPG